MWTEIISASLNDAGEKPAGKFVTRWTFRSLLLETPVDQLEVREHPAVLFRVSNNTWLHAIVRYLVESKQAGRVKSKQATLASFFPTALNASLLEFSQNSLAKGTTYARTTR